MTEWIIIDTHDGCVCGGEAADTMNQALEQHNNSVWPGCDVDTDRYVALKPLGPASLVGDDGEYADYDFGRHARQLVSVTYCYESGEWYGTMRISETDTSDFGKERPLPRNLVWALSALTGLAL